MDLKGVSEERFDFLQMAVQMVTADERLQGLNKVQLEIHHDYTRDQLVHALTAYVLSNEAGPPVEDQRLVRWKYDQPNHWTFDVAIKPWWIPKFLWNRIKYERMDMGRHEVTGQETVHLKVQPLWTYPSATVQFPEHLGPIYVSKMRRESWRV